jgi:hypothetical protein
VDSDTKTGEQILMEGFFTATLSIQSKVLYHRWIQMAVDEASQLELAALYYNQPLSGICMVRILCQHMLKVLL